MKTSTVVFGTIVVAGASVHGAPFFGSPSDLSLSALVGRGLSGDSLATDPSVRPDNAKAQMSAQMSNNRSSKNTQEMGVGMKMKANMSVQKIKADVCMHVAVNGQMTQDCSAEKKATKPTKPTNGNGNGQNGGNSGGGPKDVHQVDHHNNNGGNKSPKPQADAKPPSKDTCHSSLLEMQVKMRAVMADNAKHQRDLDDQRNKMREYQRRLAVFQDQDHHNKSQKEQPVHLVTRAQDSFETSADMDMRVDHHHHKDAGHRDAYHDNGHSHIEANMAYNHDMQHDDAERSRHPRDNTHSMFNPGRHYDNHREENGQQHNSQQSGSGFLADGGRRSTGALQKEGARLEKGPSESNRKDYNDAEQALRSEGTYVGKNMRGEGKQVNGELAKEGKYYDQDLHEDGQHVDNNAHSGGRKLDDGLHRDGNKLAAGMHSAGNDVDDDMHHDGQVIDYTSRNYDKNAKGDNQDSGKASMKADMRITME